MLVDQERRRGGPTSYPTAAPAQGCTLKAAVHRETGATWHRPPLITFLGQGAEGNATQRSTRVTADRARSGLSRSLRCSSGIPDDFSF